MQRSYGRRGASRQQREPAPPERPPRYGDGWENPTLVSRLRPMGRHGGGSARPTGGRGSSECRVLASNRPWPRLGKAGPGRGCALHGGEGDTSPRRGSRRSRSLRGGRAAAHVQSQRAPGRREERRGEAKGGKRAKKWKEKTGAEAGPPRGARGSHTRGRGRGKGGPPARCLPPLARPRRPPRGGGVQPADTAPPPRAPPA